MAESGRNVGEAIIRETIAKLQSYVDFYNAERHGDYPTFYQSIRVKSLLDNSRILVADDLGLGKTLVGVLGKIKLEERYGRNCALVVCPNSAMADPEGEAYMHGPWTATEINSYCEKLGRRPQNVVAVRSRSDLGRINGDTDFAVINYEKLSRDADTNVYQKGILSCDYGLVIVDECHKMKNPFAKRFGVLQPIIEKYQEKPLLLTSGTIPANWLGEIGTYLWMLDPKQYQNPKEWRLPDDPEAVRKMIERHQWFRLTRQEMKEELGLPDLNDGNVLDVDLSEAEAVAYFNAWKNCAFLGDKLIRLRQCEYSPSLLPNGPREMNGHSSKRAVINRLVEQKVGAGESVIIYLPLKSGIIGHFLDENKKHGADAIEGDTPYNERYAKAKRFKDGKAKVLLMTDVMSEAVDLTTGDIPVSFVFAEPPFTPREYYQPPGRVWRKGQHAPVSIYYAITRSAVLDELMVNSIDEIVEEHGIPRPKKFAPRTISQDKMRLVKYKLGIADRVYRGEKTEAWERQLFETRTEDDARKFMESMLALPKQSKPPPFTQAILMQSMWRCIGESNYKNIVGTRLGGKYAKNYTEDWDETFSAWTNNAIAKIIDADEGKNIYLAADIGSAHGCLSQALYKLGIKRPTICIDMCPRMLQIGRETCEKLKIGNYYINAKATATSLPGNSVDAAVMSYMMHFLDQDEREVEKALLEANRIVRKDGLFVAAFPWTVQDKRFEKFLNGISDYGFKQLGLSGFYRAGHNGVYLAVARETKKVSELNGNPEDFVLYGIRKKLSGAAETKRKKNPTQKKFSGEERFVKKDENIELGEAIGKYLR